MNNYWSFGQKGSAIESIFYIILISDHQSISLRLCHILVVSTTAQHTVYNTRLLSVLVVFLFLLLSTTCQIQNHNVIISS